MTPELLVARTGDGVDLSIRRYCRDEPRAACLAVHAMMANGNYFERSGFAEHLAERGIDVFVADLRGHGKSVPPSPRRRPGWSFDVLVAEDLVAAWRAMSDTTDAAKLGYLGHSLGGLVGLAGIGMGAIEQPDRLLLCATSVWREGPRGSRRRRALMSLFARSAALLGFVPARWLKVGSDDEPRRYADDLHRWVATGQWRSRAGTDYWQMLARVEAPTWAISGEGDWMCTFADAQAIAGQLPEQRPPRRVGHAFGDAIDPDHFELFTRAELRPLWDEMAEFLLSSTTPYEG